MTFPSVSLDGRQWHYRVLGEAPVDADGVEWVATGLTGLGGPAARAAREDKPTGHGAFRSPNYRAPRVIGVEFTVTAPTDTMVPALKRAIAGLCADPDVLYELEVDEPSWGTLSAQVELDGEILLAPRTTMSVTGSLQLVAPDPRLHGPWASAVAALGTAGTGGIDATSGISAVSGIDAGTSGGAGLVTVTNDGAASVLPVLRLTGPIPAPAVITVPELGITMTYYADIAAGQDVWINTDDFAAQPPTATYPVPAKSVLLQGESYDNNLGVVGGWPVLAKNTVSTWRLEAAAYDPATSLGVYWRPAYW